MTKAPVIFATRRFPEAVSVRLARDYAARLNEDDTLFDLDGLVAGADGADAIMCASTERFSADVIDPRSGRSTEASSV